jgi:serine/threonine-protein kinase ATR
MSTIFPAICEKGGIEEISTLSQQLGISRKQLLLQYGHYPLTSALMNGVPSMNTFVEIVEEVTGEDFMHMASSITPRTLSELILQTGSSNAWNSCQGILPDSLVQHISGHIALVISKSGEKGSDATMDVSALLAEGDHTTRMLKQLGDMLEVYLANEGNAPDCNRSRGPLKVVRGVIFLIRLTGRFVGRFLPQFLVLLSSSIRAANPADVRVQGLIGWTYLIRSLTADAPLQLGSVANQIVVALLDCLQEQGPVGTAAYASLEVLIEACRKLFPEKLHSLPPIPQSSPELKRMSESLQEQSRVTTVDEKVRALLEGLKDESLDVRVVTLRELRSLFLSQRQWLISISSSKAKVEDTGLLKDLISALIMSSEPEASSRVSLTARNLCAECLGMIGAIDPSRIKINFALKI